MVVSTATLKVLLAAALGLPSASLKLLASILKVADVVLPAAGVKVQGVLCPNQCANQHIKLQQ
jgi:hypothetical protein